MVPHDDEHSADDDRPAPSTDFGGAAADEADPAPPGGGRSTNRDASPDDEFEHARQRAVEAIQRDGVASMYVGLVREDGHNEFYFANDVDEKELREMAANQLGMLHRVLAEQSAASVEEVAELGQKRAEEMDLQ